MPIKIAIADDHAVVRAGLRALLRSEPSLSLIGEAAGGVEAVELAGRSCPDIMILDLSMPDLDGIEVTRRVKAICPTTSILILTVHEDEALLREAIKAGASGYVLKRAAEAELLSAINTVRQGHLYVDPALMRSLLEPEKKKTITPTRTIEELTQREVEVLKLIVQGYTNKQMAEELKLSVRTVEGHRANINDKLGLRNRVELVRFAKEHNLID
jgi:two-component system response regulator NreC